jgi:hypothetical protein
MNKELRYILNKISTKTLRSYLEERELKEIKLARKKEQRAIKKASIEMAALTEQHPEVYDTKLSFYNIESTFDSKANPLVFSFFNRNAAIYLMKYDPEFAIKLQKNIEDVTKNSHDQA